MATTETKGATINKHICFCELSSTLFVQNDPKC